MGDIVNVMTCLVPMHMDYCVQGQIMVLVLVEHVHAQLITPEKHVSVYQICFVSHLTPGNHVREMEFVPVAIAHANQRRLDNTAR